MMEYVPVRPESTKKFYEHVAQILISPIFVAPMLSLS